MILAHGLTFSMDDILSVLILLFYHQNEAAALNHKEVVEEDRQKQMPKNYAKKRERLEAEFEEEQRREAVMAQVKNTDFFPVINH